MYDYEGYMKKAIAKIATVSSVEAAYKKNQKLYGPLLFLQAMGSEERGEWIMTAVEKYISMFGDDDIPPAVKCLCIKLWRKEQQRRRKENLPVEMTEDEIAHMVADYIANNT